MDITRYTRNLEQFRRTLYQNINKRADVVLELVDAICSQPGARSVAEYSLASCFQREYTSLFKGIAELKLGSMLLPEMVAAYLPEPEQRKYYLLLLDVTSYPRPHAKTLEDRGMIYQPEVVKGKLPITIGHQYSTVALGLEAEEGLTSSWVLPMLTERVSTDTDKEMVGAKQVGMLMEAETLPFQEALTVVAQDSSYSKPACLYAEYQHDNLVTVTRARANRVFYRKYEATEEDVASASGHPTWYGDRFALSDTSTWHEPDETTTFIETSSRGKEYKVEVKAWHNIVMRGKNQPDKIPMHKLPFTLVRIVRYDKDGNLAFKNPLWLIVMGKRHRELSLFDIFDAYAARFDIEHFFRFGKQKLLLVSFQTPETEHEENWVQLSHIAYAQLWMARHLTELMPRPWERYFPNIHRRLTSPTMVQRGFGRVIRQLETLTSSPKPRGYSLGRAPGDLQPKRQRHKVVVKSQINTKSA